MTVGHPSCRQHLLTSKYVEAVESDRGRGRPAPATANKGFKKRKKEGSKAELNLVWEVVCVGMVSRYLHTTSHLQYMSQLNDV